MGQLVPDDACKKGLYIRNRGSLSYASITLTMDTYSHVMTDMQQGASDKLEQMLFTKAGTQ